MIRPINVRRAGTLDDIGAGSFRPRAFVKFEGLDRPGRVVGRANGALIFEAYRKIHDFPFLGGHGLTVGIESPDFRLASGFAITEDQPGLFKPGSLVEVHHQETWQLAQVLDHVNFLSFNVVTINGDRFWIGANHVRKPERAYDIIDIITRFDKLTEPTKS